MQITGITGESLDSNHKGWIEVTSFSHGLSHPSTGTAGGTKVAHADFALGKYLDKASLPLNLKVNQGGPAGSVIVEFQTTGNTPQVFYRVTMSDAVITSTSNKGAAGENRVTESISIAYKKILWEYWPIDANGRLGPVVRSEWDLSTNTGK